MADKSADQDRSNLAIVAVVASIVRALEGRFPGVLKQVEAEMSVIYPNLRDAPGVELATLQTLHYFRDCLRMV